MDRMGEGGGYGDKAEVYIDGERREEKKQNRKTREEREKYKRKGNGGQEDQIHMMRNEEDE